MHLLFPHCCLSLETQATSGILKSCKSFCTFVNAGNSAKELTLKLIAVKNRSIGLMVSDNLFWNFTVLKEKVLSCSRTGNSQTARN